MFLSVFIDKTFAKSARSATIVPSLQVKGGFGSHHQLSGVVLPCRHCNNPGWTVWIRCFYTYTQAYKPTHTLPEFTGELFKETEQVLEKDEKGPHNLLPGSLSEGINQ